MGNEEWAEVLRSARNRPALYVGSEEGGHLFAVAEPLRLAWESKVFVDLHSATVEVSPTQYCLRIGSGPIIEEVASQVRWGGCDVLIEELIQVGGRLMDQAYQSSFPEMERYRYAHLGSPGFALILADRGLVGIRAGGGLWCQTYDHGWPRTSPFMFETDAPIGLVVAASLSPQFFTGLPFVPGEVEAALPEAARPHVRLQYRSLDDLVTERILEPDNITDWL